MAQSLIQNFSQDIKAKIQEEIEKQKEKKERMEKRRKDYEFLKGKSEEFKSRLDTMAMNALNRINEALSLLEDKLKSMNDADESDDDDEMGVLMENLFDCFHATKDGDNYTVKQTDINIYREYDKDRIYTEAEFEKLEQRITDYFKNIDHFADYFQWENYQGVQFNLSNNPKLYAYIQDLALNDNVYAMDFLIFDTLQKTQYEDVSFKEKAEQFYSLVTEPSVLPMNKIYRALLFDEYDQLIQDYDSEKLFECWYEWNMNPKLLLEAIHKYKITFEREVNRMMFWFLQRNDQSSNIK